MKKILTNYICITTLFVQNICPSIASSSSEWQNKDIAQTGQYQYSNSNLSKVIENYHNEIVKFDESDSNVPAILNELGSKIGLRELGTIKNALDNPSVKKGIEQFPEFRTSLKIAVNDFVNAIPTDDLTGLTILKHACREKSIWDFTHKQNFSKKISQLIKNAPLSDILHVFFNFDEKGYIVSSTYCLDATENSRKTAEKKCLTLL